MRRRREGACWTDRRAPRLNPRRRSTRSSLDLVLATVGDGSETAWAFG